MRQLIYNIDELNLPAEPIIIRNESGVILDDVKEIVKEMTEIMNNNKDLFSLSAPQIGYNKRIICIRFLDKLKFFINPIITKKKNVVVGVETFYLAPGKEILISRPEEITVVYHNEEFKYEDNKLLGQAARIFDQQSQFLDGVQPSDIGLVSDIIQDGSLSELTEEEFKQVIEIYKKFIAVKSESLQAHFKEESGLEEAYKQLNFTEKVITDQIQIIKDEPERKLDREQRRNLKKIKNKRRK